ncbi:radical SAM protein [Microbacterium caowuchunii]|uniref:4Fe-4S single cluster domain-containing protein n=1 Tax=Microbacterium caowuchunii TaxID=2614638 RepID=UPI001244F7EC|nr:4Fe-4S single cluster domain-containing protein [Microbacterium caowuchunii]QEV99409.1 radical SAM protein [Microbacterium caowuchunii]
MSSNASLRVSRVLHDVTAEGPARRSAIWVQGCSIRCLGCINPNLFNPSGGHLIYPEVVIRDALAKNVEGLTLLGGEPFDQAAQCADLARRAHKAGLGVICFTGYTHETLQSDDARALLNDVDLLVDGPYLSDEPESNRSLVGSTNQRFIHLTPRYEDFDPTKSKNRLELRVTAAGTVEVAGFLTERDLTQFGTALDTRRVARKAAPSSALGGSAR